jgi:hypothetical protein
MEKPFGNVRNSKLNISAPSFTSTSNHFPKNLAENSGTPEFLNDFFLSKDLWKRSFNCHLEKNVARLRKILNIFNSFAKVF